MIGGNCLDLAELQILVGCWDTGLASASSGHRSIVSHVSRHCRTATININLSLSRFSSAVNEFMAVAGWRRRGIGIGASGFLRKAKEKGLIVEKAAIEEKMAIEEKVAIEEIEEIE